MSERIPSSPVLPSKHCGYSVKKAAAGERLVSLRDQRLQHLRRVLAWSVCWVLSVRTDAALKRAHVDEALVTTRIPGSEPMFWLYRRAMLRLLSWPKPAFDQLAIELPCLAGFRPEEVCTWRAEYISWPEDEARVLDAKKHKLFTVPIGAQIERHAEEVLDTRSNGYVLRRRRHTSLDPERPISRIAIWFIWSKWTALAGLPTWCGISPLTGRRFFAAEWYYGQGLSLVTLQRILRHVHFETTVRYVRSLVFFEDVKRDYDRFQERVMQEVLA